MNPSSLAQSNSTKNQKKNSMDPTGVRPSPWHVFVQVLDDHLWGRVRSFVGVRPPVGTTAFVQVLDTCSSKSLTRVRPKKKKTGVRPSPWHVFRERLWVGFDLSFRPCKLHFRWIGDGRYGVGNECWFDHSSDKRRKEGGNGGKLPGNISRGIVELVAVEG